MVLPMWTMSSPKGVQKQSHSCSCQGCKATNHTGTLLNLPKHWNSPEPSGTFRKLPPEPTQAHTGTLRNLPPEPTPAHTGTLRNLPPEPTPAHAGTLQNLPPEPTPAHAGTLRNLLEPPSGTCSSDPHRHTPELIWAEDPISLRCWGKRIKQIWSCHMINTSWTFDFPSVDDHWSGLSKGHWIGLPHHFQQARPGRPGRVAMKSSAHEARAREWKQLISTNYKVKKGNK